METSAPPAVSPGKLPQLSLRGGALAAVTAPSIAQDHGNKLSAPSPTLLKHAQQQQQLSSASPAASPRSSAAKPPQFALKLASSSNQKDTPSSSSAARPASPVETSAAATSSLSPSTLSGTHHVDQDTTLLDEDGQPIKVVVSDPESPAFAALLKANQEKPDISLLEKRPRIGHSKLGRHKYKPDNKSFKKPAGAEIHNQHEQYALTYGMMCGILNSAGLQNPFKQRLTMDDFMRVDKRVFPPNSKLQHPFKFKDYSPDIFRQIRRRFCIDSADYMVTLCGDFNYIEFMSNSKSGQFFFYSHDGRFMIKTQTKEESKFLRRILPHYYKFVMENPNTLITRFYGMHRVKMHHLRRKMHFIIMASVFDTPLEVQARFDLKGSTVGRRGTPKDRLTHGVLKDMDLVDSGFRLQVGAEKRAMLLVQIRKDVEFLKRMKIMDYSLLIGVHDVRGQVQKKIYGTATPEQATSKSLPASPLGDTTGAADAAFPNGELPVRLARSVSVPDDSSSRECMPSVVKSSDEVARSGYNEVDDFDSGSESSSSDGIESSSNTSDVGDFAVDRATGFDIQTSAHLHPQGSATFLTSSSLASVPSMASSLHALEPISPRVLDVHKYPGDSESVFCKDEGGIYGRDRHGRKNGYVYFVGVIDILQQYNTRKIAETFFKGFRHNRKQISAVNPVYYGDRFVEFMEKNVILDDTLAVVASSSSSSPASVSRESASGLSPDLVSPSSTSTLQQL